MSDDILLREVDEELQRDRIRKLWRTFGPFVIGGAVAMVMVVAGLEGWTWWQNSNAARSSDLFYAATEIADGTDVAAAQTALDEVIAKGTGGYPMLARFRAAALLASSGKTAEAVAAYDAISTSESNSHLRDLALVLAGALLVDGGDVAAVQQRVGGLIGSARPMRNAAGEILGLAQYKAGDLEAARASFEAVVADPKSSRDLQDRMQVYIAQLIAEGVKSKDAAAVAVDAGAQLDVTPPADVAPAADSTAPSN